ncbi:MAG: FAD-dependent oxidoreductase, partial [Treponema sp.]|nr:FAD-dependent oxidoreductase [Treponema sp.]
GNVFVDCTGDADLVGLAGIERRYGDDKTGEVQPSSHCFVLSNIDMYYYRNMPSIHFSNPDSAPWKAAKSGRYPAIKDGHCCQGIVGPSALGFNAGHLWNVDPTDPKGISENLMKGREIAHEYQQALKEYLPEVFGSSWLSQTAPSMGIRETWRIVGDYELTLEDYLKRRTFPDEIGRNCYYLDVHISEEERKQILAGKATGEEGRIRYEKGESHGIPRGILQVKAAENLLAAGRSVSADHRVQGSVRVMPVCFVMGEAAGVMAALTGKEKDIREVDTGLLRETLRKDGAYFL